MKLVQRNFSAAAAEYEARAKFQRVQCARVADAALMLLPERARVLDVGCGTGMFAQLTSLKRPHWQTIGLDIAPGMCAVAVRHGAVMQGDAAALPFKDASVDAVVSSLCVQWVNPPELAFAEMARVLKPGGRAIVASLGVYTLQELRAASAVAGLPLALLPMRSAAEYKAAIAQAGLEITAFQQAQEVEHYVGVRALLDSMRGIGAGSHLPRAGGSLGGATRWKNMVAEYDKKRSSEGIPATWDMLFMILRKIV